MKNYGKTVSCITAFVSIPFCGAWGVAAAAESVPYGNNRYVGGQPIAAYATETVEYISKTVLEDVSTANSVPTYYTDSLANACGAVAGAIIVGYYDYYYTEMIPGWSAYYTNGRAKKQDNKYIPQLISDLYTRMQTNIAGPGVSEEEFKSGLASYVNSNGYTVNYQSLLNGNFDYEKYKLSILNNELSVLFMPTSKYVRIFDLSMSDEISEVFIADNHIMIAYGYYEVRYTLNSGIRTDTYLKVFTGTNETDQLLLRLGSYIESIYVVKIH